MNCGTKTSNDTVSITLSMTIHMIAARRQVRRDESVTERKAQGAPDPCGDGMGMRMYEPPQRTCASQGYVGTAGSSSRRRFVAGPSSESSSITTIGDGADSGTEAVDGGGPGAEEGEDSGATTAHGTGDALAGGFEARGGKGAVVNGPEFVASPRTTPGPAVVPLGFLGFPRPRARPPSALSFSL